MDLEKFDQAHTYAEKQSTNQFEDGLHLIELLAPGKGDSVLDLGCGTGNLTKELASRVEKVSMHYCFYQPTILSVGLENLLLYPPFKGSEVTTLNLTVPQGVGRIFQGGFS